MAFFYFFFFFSLFKGLLVGKLCVGKCVILGVLSFGGFCGVGVFSFGRAFDFVSEVSNRLGCLLRFAPWRESTPFLGSILGFAWGLGDSWNSSGRLGGLAAAASEAFEFCLSGKRGN